MVLTICDKCSDKHGSGARVTCPTFCPRDSATLLLTSAPTSSTDLREGWNIRPFLVAFLARFPRLKMKTHVSFPSHVNSNVRQMRMKHGSYLHIIIDSIISYICCDAILDSSYSRQADVISTQSWGPGFRPVTGSTVTFGVRELAT